MSSGCNPRQTPKEKVLKCLVLCIPTKTNPKRKGSEMSSACNPTITKDNPLKEKVLKCLALATQQKTKNPQ